MKRLILILILIFPSIKSLLAKNPDDTFSVILKTNERGIWGTYIEFHNQDTVFHRYLKINKKKSKLDSIPNGEYRIRLYSTWGDLIQRYVVVETNKTLQIDLRDEFKYDHSKQNFVDQMEVNDTIFISYFEQGCFHIRNGLMALLRCENHFELFWNCDSRYPNGNSTRQYIHLSDIEFELFRDFETRSRRRNKTLHPTTKTTYSICLGRRFIHFEGPFDCFPCLLLE